MRVVNLAHQRPASAFPAGGWYLDTLLFQGFVGASQLSREEVLNSRRKKGLTVYQVRRGDFFSALPSPPWEGGSGREF
jgi:hypothetical protein